MEFSTFLGTGRKILRNRDQKWEIPGRDLDDGRDDVREGKEKQTKCQTV